MSGRFSRLGLACLMSLTGVTAVAFSVPATAGQCTSVHRAPGGWTLIDPPAFPTAHVDGLDNTMTAGTMVGDDPQTLLASDGGAVFRSADAGCNWRMVFAVAAQDYSESSLGAYAVTRVVTAHAHVPTSKQTVYLLLTPSPLLVFSLVTLFAAAPPEMLAVSHDGGRSFAIVPQQPTAAAPYVPSCNLAPDGVAVASENPESVFLHCTGGLAQDVALEAASGGVPLYHSVDGGASWSLVAMPSTANAGSVTAGRIPHSLWLAGGAYVPAGNGSSAYYGAAWHSTDDGAHWSLILPGGQTGAGLTPAKLVLGPARKGGTERVLVYNAAGVYDSDDGGRTWTTLKPLPSSDGEIPSAAAFFARGAIFVVQPAADDCPAPLRFFRYRNASAHPKQVALPTRWGVVHVWGSNNYWSTDFAVGAGGTTALAPTSRCKDNASTYQPPSFLAYRPVKP